MLPGFGNYKQSCYKHHSQVFEVHKFSITLGKYQGAKLLDYTNPQGKYQGAEFLDVQFCKKLPIDLSHVAFLSAMKIFFFFRFMANYEKKPHYENIIKAWFAPLTLTFP